MGEWLERAKVLNNSTVFYRVGDQIWWRSVDGRECGPSPILYLYSVPTYLHDGSESCKSLEKWAWVEFEGVGRWVKTTIITRTNSTYR